ncbi:histidine kinase [Oscillospiraceae bacterium PP1C4]
MLRRLGIKRRLSICLVAASVLPILLIGTIGAANAYARMKDNAIVYSERITAQTIQLISGYFDGYINQINTIATDPAILNDLMNYDDSDWDEKELIENRMRLMLGCIFGFDPEIETVELCTPYGTRFYFTSPISSGNLHGEGSSRMLAQSLLQDEITWSVSKKEILSDDKTYIILQKRLSDKSGKLAGVFLMALSREFVEQVCVKNAADANMEILLTDDQGVIISRSDDKETHTLQAALRDEIAAEKNAGNFFVTNTKEGKAMAFYGIIPRMKWRVVNLIPYTYLMGGILRKLFLTALVVGLLALLALFLSSIVTSSLVEPVNKLMIAMQHDNIKAVVSDNAEDEHALLIDGYNRMNRELDRTINEVYAMRLKESELNFLKREAELSALQQQINPHFLYNTLESVYWDGQLDGDEEISEMVTALGNYFRAIINKGREKISVEQEIESVNNYIFLQNKRFNKRIHCKWNLQPLVAKCVVMKLVLQPVIEDIISNCFDLTSGAINIDMAIQQKENDLHISITGSGVELLLNRYISADESKYLHGIKNADQRLRLYYGEMYGVKIIRRPTAEIHLLIPVKGDEA